jgi:TolA-binding protein
MKKKGLLLLFVVIMVFSVQPAFGQNFQSRLQNGIKLYGESRWREAAAELRRAEAEAPDAEQRGEALYWTGLAELSAFEFEACIKDFEELERISPGDKRVSQTAYHKGRALYYLGRYDEAIALLKKYAEQAGDENRKAAAFYWIGECLYSMGQFEAARDIFTLILEEYSSSAKYEAASYRVALINQKKIETELLALLKWSHEESLKTMEEYQRRERSYDQALIAYQKRIADLLKNTASADIKDVSKEDITDKLQEYKKSALELQNTISGSAGERK